MEWILTDRGRMAAITAALVLLAAPPAARAEVRLNEILADPASDWNVDGAVGSRDDEWVEIVNTGSVPVNLAGYRLAGADSSWRYEFAGVLGAGEVRVVYGSESYAWEQSTGNPAYGLRLANTGGCVGLWRIAGADTVMLDCHVYADHEAEDDRSTGRLPDGAEVWRIFDGLNPYTGGAEPPGSGCFPTPGDLANCPTPVERMTWGGMKLRAR